MIVSLSLHKLACRLLLEARLRPGALTHTPPPPHRPASSSDPSTRAVTPLPSPVLGVQHRLALTYALPSGEQQASSLLTSALPPARPDSTAAEGASTQPATDSSAEAPAGSGGASSGPTVLQWRAEHIVLVDEALVRSWAGSHAALPIALKAASRTQLPPPAEAAADAADAAAGGPPGTKGVTGEGKRVFDGSLGGNTVHMSSCHCPSRPKWEGVRPCTLCCRLAESSAYHQSGAHPLWCYPSLPRSSTSLAGGAVERLFPWHPFMPSLLLA